MATYTAARDTRAGWTEVLPRAVALACAGGVLLALAYVALEYVESTKLALVAVAAAIACAAVAGALLHRATRIAGRVETWSGAVLIVPSVVAAVMVAIIVDRNAVEHQWPWIALWIAAVAAIPFVFGVPLSARGTLTFVREHRFELAVVLVLLAIATAARFIRLGTLPTPFSGDEGFFSMTAAVIVESDAGNPFVVAAQSAPLYLYYLGGFQKVFGDSAEAARAASAVLGVVSVFVTYLFLRDVFNRTVAICGALFLATYGYHLQFSREAMPNIFDPFFVPLILLFTYRAMRDGKSIDYAMAGLTLGLTIYGWVSARLVPLEIGAVVVWWVVTQRSMPANWLRGVAIALVALFIAAAPFAWRSYHNPDVFNARVNQVGIFQKKVDGVHTWYEFEREKGRSPAEILGKQLRYSLETVFFTKDQWNFYGADVPLIGTGVLPVLAIGLAWSVWRVREPRYFLLIVMLFAPIVTGGVLTIPDQVIPASSSRLLAIIPAVSALVGVGAERVGVLASRRPPQQLVVATLIVVALSVASLNHYFRLYDSDGYSDLTTREIQMLAEDVHERVPEGTELHFVQNERWNLGHPRLDFGLRDYPVLEVTKDGDLVRFWNPAVKPLSGPIAMVFVGSANQDVARAMTACPDGRATRLPIAKPNEFARAIYIVDLPPFDMADAQTRHPCLTR